MLSLHTPPEGGVRTKKKYKTFDTIFTVIYQGEQKLMGPGNVGLGLFAQLQKNPVKSRKKAQKQAKMMRFFFSALTHVE